MQMTRPGEKWMIITIYVVRVYYDKYIYCIYVDAFIIYNEMNESKKIYIYLQMNKIKIINNVS